MTNQPIDEFEQFIQENIGRLENIRTVINTLRAEGKTDEQIKISLRWIGAVWEYANNAVPALWLIQTSGSVSRRLDP